LIALYFFAHFSANAYGFWDEREGESFPLGNILTWERRVRALLSLLIHFRRIKSLSPSFVELGKCYGPLLLA
jgi:hypothetical protein